MAWKTFSRRRSRRCDENRVFFVQIGAILASIRPFEVFLSSYDLSDRRPQTDPDRTGPDRTGPDLSIRDFVIIVVPSYHHISMSSCHHIIVSSYHHIIISSCHHIIISSYHHTIISSYHHIIISSYHHTIIPSSHRIIISSHDKTKNPYATFW